MCDFFFLLFLFPFGRWVEGFLGSLVLPRTSIGVRSVEGREGGRKEGRKDWFRRPSVLLFVFVADGDGGGGGGGGDVMEKFLVGVVCVCVV